MFDYKHYVPILKGKAGEYGALEALESLPKSRLTPLIELWPIPWDFEADKPAKSIDAHVKNVAQRLQRHWGTDRPLFLDLLYIASSEVMKDGHHPLKYVFDGARDRGVQLIPTTGINRDTSYQEVVKDAVTIDGRGVCIRLENDDFEDTAKLEAELTQMLGFLELSPAEADLVLDFKEISERQTSPIIIAVRSILNSLFAVRDWRTITFTGSGFPENLSLLSSSSINRRSRPEWVIWTALVNDRNKIPRLPTFGDYVIAHPEPMEVDPRLMRMSANLRYTTDNDWVILKGRNVRDYGYEQFNDLCRILVQLNEYSGPNYSWGDTYIGNCANNLEGPGNATTWRKVGTNHHLTFVTEQLASFPGL